VEVTIPPQPRIDDRLVDAFSSIGTGLAGVTRPTFGASKAWLAHLDLVKHIYQSGLESALILEDDADWDVAIRAQMANVSAGVRNLTAAEDSESSPFGSAWDILWLGHCREEITDWTERVVFEDVNVVPHENHEGLGTESLARLPPSSRAVFPTTNPLCTFAYGISRAGAGRIIDVMGAGEGEAFDVQMMINCQHGIFRCVSVYPELSTEVPLSRWLSH
jgi:hypothetical protein